jgi:nucleotidyltransferase substrate binding protein (TIGR01987 family)
MDKLTKRKDVFWQASQRLEESLQEFSIKDKTDRYYDFLRDSVIQRFEFTFDIFWKTLKDILKEQHKIMLASPRATIKECFSQNIINEKELALLEDMIDDRNNTSHAYDEVMADEIAHRASSNKDIMDTIVNRS